MALIVAILLVSAAVYFVWRRSESRPMRIVASIGGIVAILFILLLIYAVILYFRTAAP